MFSSLTFGVQKAHLFLCPLTEVFANDTKICLCALSNAAQPCKIFSGVSSSPICSCWCLSDITRVSPASPSSGGQEGDKRSPSMYGVFSYRQEETQISFYLTGIKCFSPFSSAFRSPCCQCGSWSSGSSIMCSGQMKMNQIHCRAVGVGAAGR